jgi:isocitrate dehydrogenase (NAD+)
MTTTIAVLRGDQTGEELLEQALRVAAPDVIGVPLDLRFFDLSLENRRATQNAVVIEAADAMVACGLGLKAATVTPESADDIGSPNALLRERVGGKVILRTGRRIPGVAGIGGVSAPMSVVRMAVDDAYGAREWREQRDGDEVAFRTEHISRATCRAVAEFAFQQALRTQARVFGGPKYTVSRTYEGMFKEEMDAAAQRHPDVIYEPQLIDATYALLFRHGGDSLVIPALNRDGDCLSDLVLQLFGSIAGAESLLLGFGDDPLSPTVVMAEAPHGTAPALQGKNIANPMAMILAVASLLGYAREEGCRRASSAVYEAVFATVRSGIRTADLGGHALTDEFTSAVIDAVRATLES